MTPFPLQQRPVFALIAFPNFVSVIIVTDVSVYMVVVLRDKVSFMVADHPPYNSSLSQYMHYTQWLFSLLSPSSLSCLSFLSPTLPPVSPLPLCHSLSSL